MNKFLPILAIETSGELCSVAVMLDENSFAESSIQKKHIHSQKLINLINTTLVNIDLKIEDIKLIAISEGPGSFTGLRIGFAAAKGIAFGRNLQLVPVPSLEALALQISNQLQDETIFYIANNVNTEELYFSKFMSLKNGYKIIDELQIIHKNDLANRTGETEPVYGSGIKNKQLVKLASPDAKYIAHWAYLFGKDLVTLDYDFTEPNYLKKFVVRNKK